MRAIAGTVLAAWFCCLVHAQEFEVAAIKPSAPNSRGVIRKGSPGGPGSADPGRVTYTMTTIRDLMTDAYNVKRYQISGPKWLDSELFDVVAKVPDGATKEQVRVMLQNLLAERFGLRLHRETKELPMYALVVAARGPKLKDSTAADTPQASDAPPLPPGLEKNALKIGPDGCPETPRMAAGRVGNFMVMTPNGACMISSGQTMEGLAMQLSNRFDRPVIDQTGLKGKYDLRLRFDPASMPGGRGGAVMSKDGPGPGPAEADPANRTAAEGDAPPGIFSALEEQLGLRLEARKGPVELLAIDRLEKTPTAN